MRLLKQQLCWIERKRQRMVGGALVTQEFADQIGADGFAPNAVEAAEEAERLLKV